MKLLSTLSTLPLFMLTRILLMIIMLHFCSNEGNAQLWRRVKDELKAKAEQKLREKANQVIDNAIDSIGNKSKNKKDEKANNISMASNQNETMTVQEGISTTGAEATPQDGKHGNKTGEGYIELKASTPQVFVTGMVTLTGKSIYSKEHAKNKVHILVTGNENYREEKDLIVSAAGDFTGYWYAPGLPGDYFIKAVSTDGKADMTVIIKVYDILHLDDMAKENIEETEKARKKIEQKIEQAKSSISTAQKSELDKKKKTLDDNITALLDVFHSINDANSQLSKNIGKGNPLSGNLVHNLSELNDALRKQATDIKKANEEYANHEPFDNTVCEYLVMVSEACAAFSTVASPGIKVILAVLHKIVLDKGPGESPDAANTIGTGRLAATIVTKQSGKLFFTAELKAENLVGKLGTAKFAGDMIKYVGDVLLKMYCGIYTGEMTQRFQFTFKNSYGAVWYKYGGELKAVLSLRYPKNHTGGDIIKMKGSLEGNATKFTFFADPKEAVAEELKGAYHTSRVMTVTDMVPTTVPFVSASEDKAGFGAVARAVVTPASFYIPIDAEYNVDAGQIKIFINEAIIDFSPIVHNKKFFVIIAVLPMFRRQEFPIEKAQKLIWGSLREKNWFTVTGEEVGKPRFSGTVSRKVKQQDFTIDLEITLSGRKN